VRHMSNRPKFSDDLPFEAIMEAPALDDPGVAALVAHVGVYPSQASATRYGFRRFRALLEDVGAPWKDELIAHCDRIVAGSYRHEFGQTYNRYARISGGYECSQTSELFSLFTQAVHYNR